jgi:hypothetical protein
VEIYRDVGKWTDIYEMWYCEISLYNYTTYSIMMINNFHADF